jgi:putative membrane-bound dehydrogenase-like protein
MLLLVAVPALPGAEPAAQKTHQVKLNGHTFTLPVDFEIELVAGPPLIDRPIEADFDEQGRLYVTDSSGSNDPVNVQLEKKPHRVVRLEDTKGNGHFDRRTIYADKLMFPEGAMWYAGSLYVSAAPSIWKLTDTKGDGKADQRVEWFQGKTLTGCANDLHGPYLGPDGWIYWCKGAFAKQTYPRPSRPPLVTRAAHIFRCRPDGSGIEPVMTGGMDNPVEVVFTSGGERIFTTTFFQHPGGGRRDGLVHAIYGGVYGKDHDVIYDHPWTSPTLMPVLTHLGAAAPCGLIRYESAAGGFGHEYEDNLFACLFNMHKITRHILTPSGASFTCKDEDFLVSDNLDFHPTDVLEDADGSLLIIDTGGWYKLCCPTSQLHKPDVLGAIYRIHREGVQRPADPRGLQLRWSTMDLAKFASLLDDPRPAVRRRAVQGFADKAAAVQRLADNAAAVSLELTVEYLLDRALGQHEAKTTREKQCNALWTSTRIDSVNARKLARGALCHDDEIVRQVAIHSVSLWRDRTALPTLCGLLKEPSLHNRRAAAEAIGRIGDRSAVPYLLDALGSPADRALEHSLTYALIEIGNRDATAAGLKSTNPLIRRAALTAFDQMPGGNLKAEVVAKELAAPDARLKETAWWIAGRHPEWGGALAGFLQERLSAKDLPAAERDELVHQLARFARAASVQELLTKRLRDADTTRDSRRITLRAMAQANLKEAPAAWLEALTQFLTNGDRELFADAVVTARALHLPKQTPTKLVDALLLVSADLQNPKSVRYSALAAVPGGLTDVDPPLFAFLRAGLDPEQPVAVRGAAAEALAHARLNTDQLLALAQTLASAGPLEVDRLLDAFGQSTDERVGRALIASLKTSPARAGLRVASLKPRLAKFGPKVEKPAEELYALLDADAGKQRARLEALLGALKEGDVRRGQVVFNGTKAACASCHAIGYLGGDVGPDLTHIGKIRSERDLLESIVFPSASFVRSYEPMLVTTKDGKLYNGVVRKDAPDEVVLALNATQQIHIARDDIEEMVPSKVSVMPAGLDQQLTRRDLADLVAFLKACK